MRGVIISDCKGELDEVVAETNTERNDKILRHECFLFFYFFLNKSNLFYYFISVMMTIMINSILGMQLYLLGISARIDQSMHRR